jgi:uncharacterized protein (TIGR02266 family)
MAERALAWVRTLLAAKRIDEGDDSSQHVSGVHTIDLTAAAGAGIEALRLVPERDGETSADDPSRSSRLGAIELEFAEDSHFFTGLSQDISGGGIFVATYERLPVGTRLKLCFETPDGPFEARGQVRWTRDAKQGEARPGLGIVFTELSEEAMLRITRYCARTPPLYVDF